MRTTKKDYNYAQERAPFNQAPIKMIDASIDPPALTSYPEYPIREYSSPPEFNVAVVKFASVYITSALVEGSARDSHQRSCLLDPSLQGQGNLSCKPIERHIIAGVGDSAR